jgi:putative ABC transport system permease protein
MMPEWKQEISHRLAALKLEPTREVEIVEELSQRLEDRYTELLAAGATPEEASRAAVAELSESETLQKELRRVERQAWREPVTLGANSRNNMLGDLWQDLRYGLRAMGKNPGFTAVTTLMLALGIGANTAIFTVIDALMLKPLPVRSPVELVIFKKVSPNGVIRSFSYREYEGFLALSQVFSVAVAITGSEQSNVMINGAGGAPSVVDEGQARVDPMVALRCE